LPRPPLSEYTPTVMRTLTENQHLFTLITPVNIVVFESLLIRHPNQPFVRSVVDGLREGFWPWADTDSHRHSGPNSSLACIVNPSTPSPNLIQRNYASSSTTSSGTSAQTP
jgi:hypothetical protein